MRFKELLLENWSLKLIAIFLAVMLWLTVRGDPNAERVLSVPLEIRLPRNMEITSGRPNSVDVTVRGAFANMWFAATPPTYFIDMQAYDEGDHIIQLLPENVRFPRASGLEAVAVRPARLKLTLERAIAREVPIKVVTRGQPALGFDVYEISVSPSTAVLSGPRSGIERIKEVDTEIISLAEQRQSIRTFANLNIRDDMVHSTPPGPVEVDIRLGPHRRLHTIMGVPVVPDEKGMTVVPQSVSIQVLVPTTLAKPLTAEDFTARVATSRMAPGESVARIRPEIQTKNGLDPAIVIRSVQPGEVAVYRNKKS